MGSGKITRCGARICAINIAIRSVSAGDSLRLAWPVAHSAGFGDVFKRTQSLTRCHSQPQGGPVHTGVAVWRPRHTPDPGPNFAPLHSPASYYRTGPFA
ncbi:hypothetical protein AAFF_G00005780 [Aldrovandia affinis]|uniref:Uncharacterized protein n=1 Tax=Aldrovandia affinis TaxID=143900 RepID=A0AAD7TDQ1_9TELE|nr:hypothetical protein AAFF_G00005780 [Aldrovandia affinis]